MDSAQDTEPHPAGHTTPTPVAAPRLAFEGLVAFDVTAAEGPCRQAKALGFWKALRQVYGKTRWQRCWVHKSANVLDKLPKDLQPQAKQRLQAIWMAPDRQRAEIAFDLFIAAYEAQYPKAAGCLAQDREVLLAFYDFPAEHWGHIRTTNPVESTFATVRLHTDKMRGCLSRTTMLAMVFKLYQSAQKRWHRLRAAHYLTEVIQGTTFKDGIRVAQDAA